MNVSAIIVTRGNVGLDEIVRSFPSEWEVIVWDNSRKAQPPNWWKQMKDPPHIVFCGADDFAVYGRYAAIAYATNDLIYVQDDDCVLADPRQIVDEYEEGYVVCNMPANFRARHFYDEHSLVGFGACFHRDAPARAFDRFRSLAWGQGPEDSEWLRRTCDIVFTALTPRVLVDVPYDDMPWASADNRMWKQPTHQEERSRMLELVLQVRDNH